MNEHSNQRKQPARSRILRGAARPGRLLLALVARARWLWLGWLEAKWAAFQQWRQRRQAAAAHVRPERPVIETLEPRLLLSAELMPLDAAPQPVVQRLAEPPASSSADDVAMRAHILTTAPVAAPTVTLTGPGSAQVVAQGSAWLLQLSGTTAASTVALTNPAAGQIALAGISADSAVGTLNLANADLQGNASFAASVGTLTLGRVSQSQITVTSGAAFAFNAAAVSDSRLVARAGNIDITVASWTSSTAGASRIEAAGLKTLTSTGDLGADLFLSGMSSGFTLGTVQVGGNITGGLWSVHGRGNAIGTGSTAAGWRLNMTSGLAQLVTRADASGDLSVGGVQLLQVGGSARGLHVYAGTDLGDDAALGGTGANADHFSAGTIARVRITGDLVDSTLVSSIDPVNGVFFDGNDQQIGTPVQRLQELVVGGRVLGTSSLVAPYFATTVSINGQTLDPATLPAFVHAPADTTAPTLLAFGLAPASDTGTAGDGRTTLDSVTLIGRTEAGATVTLKRGGTTLGTATAIGDGSFIFIGVALAVGDNAFTVTLADAAGNTGSGSGTIVRDVIVDSTAPVLQAALQSDTGSSSSDGLTSNPVIAGTATDDTAVTQLLAALDPGASPSFTDLSASLQGGGAFTLSRAQLDTLAGGTLAQGAHVLRLVAKDAAGNSSSVDVAFNLDTAAPAIAGMDLAPASDTGGTGDQHTTAATVRLQGSAEALATLALRGAGGVLLGSTSAAGDGSFAFSGIALALGDNSFELTATDAAGNSSTRSFTFTRDALPAGDTTAPALSAALSNDTGLSNTDAVSRDPALAGQATDDTAVTQLQAVLDPGATPAFTDLSSLLQPDGRFSIDRARLDALAGGTLAEGSHLLRLVASDAAGNTRTLDIAFRLDLTPPSGASFGISSLDALAGDTAQSAAGIVSLVGTAEGGARIELVAQGLSSTASDTGTFQLPGVALANGDNTVTLTVTDLAGNSQTVTRTLTRVSTTQSDAVLSWIGTALSAIQRDVSNPTYATRVLAIQSLAVYDTLAAIQGTPAYLVQRSVASPTDAQAAAAQAAYRVLHSLYPGQRAAFDAALATSLATVADGAAKDAGIALGDEIARAVLAIRASDGYLDFVQEDGSTDLGDWRPTGPMYLVAQDPQWGSVTPFALTSGDEFRAAPPPDLSSPEYAAAINEVQSLGSATGSTRTADQTQQAQFWADGGGSITPPGHWDQIALQVAQAKGNSLSANARLMAQLNVALADAAIACWDTKYSYDFWRPVTAIQSADLDGNPLTTADPDWTPLLITPPHPTYISGHSTFSAAAAGILAATFGDDTAFSTTSSTLPGVTRSFTSFSQAAAEAGASRIYGGIHTSLDNLAGREVGTQVAQAVLARFALTQDKQAPTVVLAGTPPASNGNLTITGQVLDNLSGVDIATIRIDGGAAQALTVDATGHFSFTTQLATDGTADGTHTFSIVARDRAANTAPALARSFTLDTRAPALTLGSIAEGATLSAGMRLAGTADANGSALTLLQFQFDGGTTRSLAFDTQGAFDTQLDFSTLAVGNHTLTLTARDAAGNQTVLSRTVVVDALPPFQISTITPASGSADVGVTQRPQVTFSRPVNPATLTSASFYATGPDGAKLPATIVPAADGSFAWLFFTDPMPGSSSITLHLDGTRIRAAADGAFLDANGTGSPGGERTLSFTTVSTTSVAGTKIVGRVVDPGPDLKPMTFDDIRRGPDGVIHTADDVFLLPIAHAKVYILGQENRFVFTDANGFFELDDVPAGTVKVAVDGRTATNAPAGVFFPEMVMDAEIQPGVSNTLMGSMGSVEQRLENADRSEVYLPRVPTSALQPVSDSSPTVITVQDPAAASQLTDQQRQALTLTIAPGAAIGADGAPVANAQIGIATVPPELVKDMLPPGVMQHTFDITIQAPGVSTFAEPVQITFPNVFNAAPGTQLNILSFDHTTGMLVINGTGTVSADGLTVVSDPGSGVKAPGWHGLTPPGGCGGSGGPPPAPTPPQPGETVNENPATALPFITGNGGSSLFNKTWNAPPPRPGAPVPPPIPDCDVPPHNPSTDQDPFINVTIEIDGPLADFAKQTGDLGLVGQSFTLSPGGGSKTFSFDSKTYAEMFGATGIASLNRDQLYGSKIKITVIEQMTNGDRVRTIDTWYLDRWVDVVDAPVANTLSGNTAAFMRTNTDGVVRQKNVDVHLGSYATSFSGPFLGSPFDLGAAVSGSTTAVWKFDPFLSGARSDSFDIKVTDPVAGDLTVGTIVAKGTATNTTTVSVDQSGYETELRRVLTSLVRTTNAGADNAPGVAGVDDNGDGATDDATEFGYAGSDDGTALVYDYGGGTTTQATVGPGGVAGTVNLVATSAQVVVTSATFQTQFAGYLPGDVYTPAAFNAMLSNEGAALLAAVQADYAGVTGITVQAGNFLADVTMSWHDVLFTISGVPTQVYGSADFDLAKATVRPLIATTNTTIGEAAKDYALAEALNHSVSNSGQFAIGINTNWSSGATFAQFVANTVSHELGHTFGLNDAYLFTGGNTAPMDIMRGGSINDGDLTFGAQNLVLLQAAMGTQPDGDTPLGTALTLTQSNFNLPNSATGIREFIVTPAPELGLVLGQRDLLGKDSMDFGAVTADGAGGTVKTLALTISNPGQRTVTLGDLTLGGTSGFSLVGASLAGTRIEPGSKITLQLAFDPSVVGAASDTLTITSNARATPLYKIRLTGSGVNADPTARVTLANNNLGGLTVGASALQRQNVFKITNDGAQPLVISSIGLTEGAGAFALLGVRDDLATTPITLAPGQSFSFGASFSPQKLGLQRGLINVATNDPTQANLRLSVVGTGVAAVPRVQWGNDFFAIEDPTQPALPALRTVSDERGNFSFFLPNSARYHIVGYDPATGLVTHSYGKTGASGKGTDLTATMVFAASTAPDSDFDGLPDDVEFAVGTSKNGRDTDKDGLDDFTEVRQGLDPLGALRIPVGLVSAAALQGSAEAVTVAGTGNDAAQLTALVATGNAGLAVVDVTQFTTPRVLAQLDLPGDNVDVASDDLRHVAAVAGSSAGLHLVDVTNPQAPVRMLSVDLGAPVTRVAIVDGIAYAAAGNKLVSVDVLTGEVRATLDLAPLGGGAIVDLAIDRELLVLVDTANVLRTLRVGSSGALTVAGSLSLPAAGGRLFVAGGVAYVGAGNGGIGGFVTVNVGDPAAPALLSGVDDNAVAGTALALNGSGLAVGVGSSSFVFGGFKSVDVFNAADPANTGALITRINLPQVPRDLALAGGLAFVADGTGGLQVVNYRSLDNQGVAPTVSIAFDAVDADAGAPGVQVLEGRTVHIVPTVGDDVQVRSVELLVNGKVVSSDLSFPFDFFAQVPSIASGGNRLTVQVRATDTGGNVSLSNLVGLDVVPDTFAPVLQSVSVAEGDRRFFVRSIDLVFDEPLDSSRLTGSAVTLVRAGADGSFGTADDVAVPVTINKRAFGQSFSILPGGLLPPGEYELRVAAAGIADLAGNALAAPVVRHFTIRTASEVRALTGTPEVPTAPSANPGQQIAIAVPFDPATARATFQVTDASGNVTARTVTVFRTDTVRGLAYFNVPLDTVSGDAVVFSQVGTVVTNFPDGTFPLQIVPTIVDVQVESISGDGATAQVLIAGTGFAEGVGSSYFLGSTEIADTSNSTSPDVFGRSDPVLGFIPNGYVRLTVPLSNAVFGAINVKTGGGTSAVYATNLGAIGSVAFSGTPADAGQGSANPGQAIVVSGSGFSLNSDILLRWSDINGALQMTRLSPTAVSADGTSATLVIPPYANGAYQLQMFGSASQPLLQIVPTLSSFDLQDRTVLFGSGFVEGSGVYSFAGVTLGDTPGDNATGTADVYYDAAGQYQNGSIYINRTALPNHGIGNATVSTAGGTSAPLQINTVRTTVTGTNPGDVAVDAAGNLWINDQANPGHLIKIDRATGQQLTTITLNTAGYGQQFLQGFSGLQITTAAMQLNGVSIPVGNLLVYTGQPNTDRVVAVNVANGAVLASLSLAGNHDLTGGTWDPTSDLLFIARTNTSSGGTAGDIIAVNPATGGQLSVTTTPLNFGSGAGLAIQSSTGHLWAGALSNGSTLIEYQIGTGGALTELRRIDISAQGINQNEIVGLSFDATGQLWVASSQGDLVRVDVDADTIAVPTATLSGLASLALQGTPASAGVASANVGQVIELTGTNFGAGTRVLFNVRDNEGNTTVVDQTPLAIDAAGTRLQVLVPNQATTGDVRVVNQGSRNLGFNSYADAVYRTVTVSFVADAATAAIRWADGGLQGASDESWGLDNVIVKRGDAVVFADNFEAGANAAWSDATVDASDRATFSRFSGRFSGGVGQTLNLSGLTTGQTYTISFDLLALDSWDGNSTSGGPDLIDLSVNGKSLLHETLANYPDPNSAQTFRATSGIRLQIVPTLDGINGARPGEDSQFNLTGSGFMEGASIVTIGGVALTDAATNLSPFDVSGSRNDNITVVAPRTLDGPIRISTEGGYAQIPASFPAQPASVFSGINASAVQGNAGSLLQASANTGQSITLTGQGFSSSTLVQFQGRDDSGATGTLTRTGSVGGGGTTLTLTVPALATSGAVTVLGSNTSYNLQVVPTLKSVGGAVTTGNTIVLEGTGLSAQDLSITIDGRGVGSYSVRTIVDGTNNSDQQLVTLTVPAGVSAGQITVSTAGGSATIRRGDISIAAQPDQAPGTDVGDTIATALDPGLNANQSVRIASGITTVQDVDLHKVQLNAGDQLSLNITASAGQTYLRIFNAAGTAVAGPNFFSAGSSNNAIRFVAPASGTYYVGVSGYNNGNYDPNTAGTGANGSAAGDYTLVLARTAAGQSRLSGGALVAALGTPAAGSVPSANTGQVITLTGAGFISTDRLVFTGLDDGGNLTEVTVTPSAVDLAAQTITAAVPANATTGRVRLERDDAGMLLQIVPTLGDVTMSAGGGFEGYNLQLTGSGFAEGATSLQLGGRTIGDVSRFAGMDVFSSGTRINFTVPSGAATGPVRVTTVGGTSPAFAIGLSGISATGLVGTATNGDIAAANAGQAITLLGTGLDATTDVVFQVFDGSGAVASRVVRATTVNAGGTQLQVIVPLDAVSGVVRVVGSSAAIPLQIVPTVLDLQVESVSGDGATAQVLIAGTGFVDGGNSEYRFGSAVVLDAGPTTGADVFGRSDPVLGFIPNGYVRLTVPLSNAVFGAINVKTGGGTSAVYATNLGAIGSVAFSGTPADAGQGSANPGQAIVVSGSGFSLNSDILLRWSDINGALQMTRLSPTAVSADGSSATLVIPPYANGAYQLQMFGSASQPLLQIVPTLSSFDLQDRTVLFGSGFVEGSGVYSFAGVTLGDTPGDNATGTADVYYDAAGQYQNGSIYINRTALPNHGIGNATVSTAGGTSAPLQINTVRTTVTGTNPGDVAVDAAGNLWINDQANPGHLIKIDRATGQQLTTITLNTAGYGQQFLQGFSGLQITTAAMQLNGVSIPVGNLLVYTGQPNTDRVVAVNVANGAVLASLSLAGNHDLTGGTWDPTSDLLFIARTNTSSGGTAGDIIAVNPATGGQLSVTTTPLNFGSGAGLAIQSSTGHLWAGALSNGSTLIEYQIGTGGALTELRRIDISAQGINQNEIVGLSFDATGQLWVASSQGDLVRVDVDADTIAVPTATLSGLASLALQGTPASAGVASANVGQVIELTGTNFGAGTRVLFNVRDNEGNTTVVDQTPLAIDAAGTRLQVLVPNQATTGDVRVVNQGSRNLGFNSYADAVYRTVTVSFVADAATAAIRWADGGLQGASDESWGLDNVIVKRGDAVVFADNFEAGANAAWSDATVDASDRATFSRFSGRFSGGVGQTLNLSGLTTGQTYTISFDLLALDSWDGNSTSGGPDLIDLSVNGKSLLHETLANYPDPNSAQTFRATSGIRLQIVPTLDGINGARPGEDSQFNLTGSGFMEGASIVTIGGVALTDAATNLSPFDVSGSRNDNITVVAPRTLDGPIRISTEGGYAQIPASFPAQPASVFSGINASAVQGNAGSLLQASANTGQSITLTGQGFSSSTLVQFQGRDDSGATGTLTRTGSVGGGGTTLTLTVPALATSGAVTVLGSNTSYNLQVVPTLKSVGGAVTTGNTIVLEGTGLSAQDLSITIDGRGVGSYSVRTIVDGTNNSDQQLVTLTVPAGVSAGQITVSTAGGSATIRRGDISIAAQPDQAPGTDVGDTIATALDPGLNANQSVRIASGITTVQDVDLHKVQLNAGDQLSLNITASAGQTYLRIFNAAGTAVAGPNFFSAGSSNNAIRFVAPASGTYYVGVSGYNNGNYDPNTAGTGANGSAAGDYTLVLARTAAGQSRLLDASATAGSGLATLDTVAGANTGQVITLNGTGLVAGEQVVFTTLDDGGNLAEQTVFAATVAGDGSSLTVTVPAAATTGRVRLSRDDAGILLQIVPTLSGVTMQSGGGFESNSLQITGSGFAEGASSVQLGGRTIDDLSRFAGLDVVSGATRINLTVPSGAATGPVRVTTVGGTSAPFAVGLASIVAGAASGTPADGGVAAANAGQTITLTGSSLTTTTSVVFKVVDAGGNVTDRVVRPATAAVDGSQATVVVPIDAVTGDVRIIGSPTAIALQILPTIVDLQVESVAADGSSAQVLIAGTGLVEGANSEYRFGSGVVLDAGTTTGADVFGRSDTVFIPNGYVRLTVPLSNGVFGAVSIKTAGGTSQAYSASLGAVATAAASGTPADAGQGSANAGQTITVNGNGFTLTSDILLRWSDTNGALQMTRLSPATVAVDGSSATLVIPPYANGAYALQMFGSATQPLLQIVPTLTSFDLQDRTVLFGSGFVEGAGVYSFAGVTLGDTPGDNATGSADVYYDQAGQNQNGSVYINRTALPNHGIGNVTVTTAGGTSAPLLINTVRTTVTGTNPGDVAVDAAGNLWINDQANPGHLIKIDPGSGLQLQTITLNTAGYGQQFLQGYSGLQITTAAMQLNGVSIPVGSLLVYTGQPNTDRVVAVNVTNGAVLASLGLASNYDLTGGTWDPTSNLLFIARTNGGAVGDIVALNPATGAQVGVTTTTLNFGSGAGLAIQPSNGHLWAGALQSGSTLIEYQIGAGGALTELRRVDISTQGINQNEIVGLSFDAAGNLWVASSQGDLVRVSV